MRTTDVQGTLREMWETRPARPRDDRQIAGVATAIARRYDIDPVLVRVGFVVSAFYGIGAALYIAGWILLPEGPAVPTAADPAGTRRPVRPKPVFLIGLAIATAISLGALFTADRGLLLPAVVALGLLFLLHRSRGHRGPVAPAAAPGTPDPAPRAAAPRPRATPRTGEAPTAPVGPPAWDPLGAAPFAWDLPEPSPAEPAAPRPRRLPVTAVTLAVALLAGGATGILLLAGGSLASLPVLFGVVLAVLGTGLVVGAFTRSGRGLIPVALVISALTWAVVAAPLDRWQGGFADVTERPLTAAAVAPRYEQSAGSIALDLRAVDLSVPPGTTEPPVHSALSVGAGLVEVRVPQDADVTVRAHAGAGSVDVLGRESAGPDASLQVTDLGADGVASGRPIVLDIDAGLGSVEVHRG